MASNEFPHQVSTVRWTRALSRMDGVVFMQLFARRALWRCDVGAAGGKAASYAPYANELLTYDGCKIYWYCFFRICDLEDTLYFISWGISLCLHPFNADVIYDSSKNPFPGRCPLPRIKGAPVPSSVTSLFQLINLHHEGSGECDPWCYQVMKWF